MKITENYIELTKQEFVHIMKLAIPAIYEFGSADFEEEKKFTAIKDSVKDLKYGELFEIRVVGDK